MAALSPTPETTETGGAPATFYSVVGVNDTYWRVDLPARAVGAKSVKLQEDDFDAITDQNTDSVFPWTVDGDTIWWGAQEGDVAVWTRPDILRARHSVMMEDCGIRTVAEVDDNYLSATHLNVFMRINQYDEEARTAHLKAMCCHQAIVFSTCWLRDRYAKEIRRVLGKKHIPELFVCRNHVDLDDWMDEAPKGEKLRVGWMGSLQHGRDLKLAYPALKMAHEAGCEVVIIGLDPAMLGDLHGNSWDIPTTHIPWIDPIDYHRTPLPLDIGIVPLETNDHTLGKSDVKALEYTIAGAACVLQNNEVYNREWRHNETALMANSREEIMVATAELIRSRSLRERLVSAAKEYVREERSMQVQGAQEWRAALCL